MEYKTIFILDNNKGELIVERPREFIGNILKGLDGYYSKTNEKKLMLGHEKIGEILPLKNNVDDTLYVYVDGKLVEFNPSNINFSELEGDSVFFNKSISILESIYSKVKREEPIQNLDEDTFEDGLVDFSDNLDVILADESEITFLKDELTTLNVDENIVEVEIKKTAKRTTTKKEPIKKKVTTSKKK